MRFSPAQAHTVRQQIAVAARVSRAWDAHAQATTGAPVRGRDYTENNAIHLISPTGEIVTHTGPNNDHVDAVNRIAWNCQAELLNRLNKMNGKPPCPKPVDFQPICLATDPTGMRNIKEARVGKVLYTAEARVKGVRQPGGDTWAPHVGCIVTAKADGSDAVWRVMPDVGHWYTPFRKATQELQNTQVPFP